MVENEKAIQKDSSSDVGPPVTGSPIIIGGGGTFGPVSLKFKSGDYERQTGSLGRTRFVIRDAALNMQKLKFGISNQLADLSPFLQGADNDNDIEVHCAGSDNNIRFFIRPLAVEFNTRTYVQQPEPDPQGRDVFKSEDSVVSKVTIELPGLDVNRRFNRTEECTVEADYVALESELP